MLYALAGLFLLAIVLMVYEVAAVYLDGWKDEEEQR